MTKNIFENSKFGDKFQARDGAMAIFVELVHSDDFNTDFAKLLDNVTLKVQHYNLDGTKINSENKSDSDIISKWEE